MTRSYRLTTTSRSASTGAMQETVVITAENDAEAVELARAYVEAVGAEALFSATLADAAGTIIWRQGGQDRGGAQHGGSPRNGGSV